MSAVGENMAGIEVVLAARPVDGSVLFRMLSSLPAQQGVLTDAAAALGNRAAISVWPDANAAAAGTAVASWPDPDGKRHFAVALLGLYASQCHPAWADCLAALLRADGSLVPFAAQQAEMSGMPCMIRQGMLHLVGSGGGPKLVGGERLFVDIEALPPPQSAAPDKLRFALERRQAWLRHRFGAVYAVLVTPDKQSVHSSAVPPDALAYTQRLAPVLRTVAAAQVPLCHPLAELCGAAGQRDPYYQTDSHWNDYGAYVAYGALLRTLAPHIVLPPIGEDRFVWKQREVYTDLGMALLPEVRETALYAHFDDGAVAVTAKSTLPSSRYGWQVYENQDKSLPTAVVFRDSFFTAMIPFMARSLSKLVCVGVDAGEMLVDLVEDVRPDLVVSACVERFAQSMNVRDLFRDEVPWKDGVGVGPAVDGRPVAHYGAVVDAVSSKD